MTQTATSGREVLAKKRTYRRLMFGSIAGGVGIGFLLRGVLGYPLLGEAVYWVGVLGFLAVWQGTSLTLFDERDRALERRASQLTLVIFAPVLAVGAGVARVLPRISDYAVPEAVGHALYAYVALYAVFGVVYLGLRYRR